MNQLKRNLQYFYTRWSRKLWKCGSNPSTLNTTQLHWGNSTLNKVCRMFKHKQKCQRWEMGTTTFAAYHSLVQNSPSLICNETNCYSTASTILKSHFPPQDPHQFKKPWVIFFHPLQGKWEWSDRRIEDEEQLDDTPLHHKLLGWDGQGT